MNRLWISIIALLIVPFALKGQQFEKIAQSEIKQYKLIEKVNLSEIRDDWLVDMQHLEPREGNENYKEYLKEVKAEVSKRFPKKKIDSFQMRIEGEVDTPIVIAGFEGNHYVNGVPNDNSMAISNGGKLISAINSSLYFYDVTEDSLYATFSFVVFSSSLTGISTHQYDPKIIYDPDLDRFVVIFLAGASSSFTTHIIVAFSESNDPMGNWNVYALPGNPIAGDVSWTDYPAVSLGKDEMYITGNLLAYGGSWQTSFKQSVIWQIDKHSGFEGDSALTTRLWSDIIIKNVPVRNLHPVRGGAELFGPQMYFLSNKNFAVQSDLIYLLEITGGISDPNTELILKTLHSSKTYGAPPSAQQIINKPLQTNDARVLGAFHHHTYIQFVANTVDTTNGFAAVYHGFVDDVAKDTPLVIGTILSDSILEFGYPNLSFTGTEDSSQQCIITFDHTGSTTFPGFSALFCKSYGEYSPRITLKHGVSPISVISGEERWGDYSGTQRKYDEPGVVWASGTWGKKVQVTGGYKRTNGTWIAGMKSPYKDSIPLPPVPIDSISGKTFPNPAYDTETVFIELELPEDMHLKAVMYDIQGNQIKVLLDEVVEQGRNQLTFVPKMLAAGLYVLRFTDTEGKVIYSEKILIQ